MKLQEFKETSKPMDKIEADKLMENAIKEAIEVYKKTGDIELAPSKYDWLDSKGKMQGALYLEEWNNVKRDKMNSVRTRLIEVFGKAKAISFEEKIEIKNTLKDLQEKKCGMVISQCKLELLKDYFDKL
jgi:LytS/YehU family sensor histidine kinase